MCEHRDALPALHAEVEHTAADAIGRRAQLRVGQRPIRRLHGDGIAKSCRGAIEVTTRLDLHILLPATRCASNPEAREAPREKKRIISTVTVDRRDSATRARRPAAE